MSQTQIPMCNNAPQKCGSRSPKEGYSQAGRGEAFLYAESADGITWTKPVRAALFSAFSSRPNKAALFSAFSQV